MKKPKEYPINTMRQLGDAVTMKNLDMVLANMKESLLLYIDIRETFKANGINDGAHYNGFRWIDDGKTEIVGMRINIKLKR